MLVQRWCPVLFSNVRRVALSGFTLPETATILILIGVLSTIAAPNLLSWYRSKQIDNQLVEVVGAFKEARAIAIRESRNCTLSITTGPAAKITANPVRCLETGQRMIEDVHLRRSGSLAILTFDYKGETGRFSPDVLVLSNRNSRKQRCLVIDGPLGMMRTGRYLSSDRTGLAPTHCTTQP